jgi:hypothetical protein
MLKHKTKKKKKTFYFHQNEKSFFIFGKMWSECQQCYGLSIRFLTCLFLLLLACTGDKFFLLFNFQAYDFYFFFLVSIHFRIDKYSIKFSFLFFFWRMKWRERKKNKHHNFLIIIIFFFRFYWNLIKKWIQS